MEDVDDGAQVAVGFREARAFRRHVAVMEGEERRAQQAEHLEGDIGLHLRHGHRITIGKPGPLEGRPAEGIVALPAEGMPIADGEAQVILHALAQHPWHPGRTI